MIVGKRTAFCLMALIAVPAALMAETDTMKVDSHYFYKELNHLENLYFNTQNPVRLSKNEVKTIADASFDAQFSNGEYHAVDMGRKSREFKVNIGGLKNFGRLDVYGHIDYTNGKEYAHKWNSTLFVTETNPFVLGDDIASDVNTEIFSMSAAASYQFSKRFAGALALSYKTGCFSDQTDPRPKTNAMHFGIRPGVELKLNETHALGLSAMVDFFHSDLSHSVINNNNNYTYYVMKGMGDFMVVTSNDMSSYPREYKGNKYNGALQWTVTPQNGAFRNMLEVSFATNREIAEDGGYAFTFKGGDYYRKDLQIYERFSIEGNERYRQNITLTAAYTTDYGNWYDQKKVVDTEHGNMPYYKILNKSKISETSYINAHLAYQGDFMKGRHPHLTLMADLGFGGMDSKYYSSKRYNQKVNMLQASAGIRKHFNAGSAKFSAMAGIFYATPMGTPQYMSANPKTADTFTGPQFEYIASSRLGFNIEAKAFLPVNIYKHTTLMGIKLHVNSVFYQGDSLYSHALDSSSRTMVDAAFNFIF